MEKYNPNPINYGIIPKQWLNTPVMSSEEAFMELEKLQNAELANEINQQNAEVLTRKNQAQKKLVDEYEAQMEAKRQAGEPELLNTEAAMNLAKKYQILSGDPGGLVDDELRKIQIQSLDEERKRRAKESQYEYSSESPYNRIVKINKETGERTILQEPTESRGKDRDTAGLYINPKTFDVQDFDSKEDARQAGYTMSTKQVDARESIANLNELDPNILNPAGGAVELNKTIQPPIDFKVPPGSKRVRYSMDGKRVQYVDAKGKLVEENIK